MQTTIKASNAVAALVDYYQSITAEHLNQLQHKDELIARVTEQLRVFSSREEAELAIIAAAIDLVDNAAKTKSPDGQWVNITSALFIDLSDAVLRYRANDDR